MLNYIVAEISGKQYKISPKQVVLVDFLGDLKEFECNKVLLKSEDGKLEVGNPFLKKGVNFEVLEGTKKTKIRVATFKSKANYRRVIGQKTLQSKIRLIG